MRIGLILSGGVEEGTEDRSPFPVFVELIRRLARENDVQVFSLQGENRVRAFSVGGPKSLPYRFAGADVFQLGTTRAPRFRIAVDVLRVLAVIHSATSRARRPQILHGIDQAPGFVTIVAGRLLGVPSVVSLIGKELTDLPSIGYGGLQTAKGRAMMELELRCADALTAASGFMQRRVHAHGAYARRLPFGIDVERFQFPVTRPAGPPFRLLHVGTLYPVKDQLTLVRAIRLVVDSGFDVELDIVGWDAWGGSVQREAAQLGLTSRIRFHGWKAQAELIPFYRNSHVFVMASVDDVAPVAVLEAAASGVAVVGTDVGFIADWAPEMAVKSPISDPVALARGLKEVLSNQGYREELASRAQKWVVAHASLEANDAFVDLYRELVDRRAVFGASSP
jgi:glycosyltransferase involved in cell wall biosynthesis